MIALGSVFYVEGGGSRFSGTKINVSDTALLAAYEAETSRNFNILIATDSSTASIDTVLVKDCDGVDVGLSRYTLHIRENADPHFTFFGFASYTAHL